jgi:hypothetical protein
MAGSNTNEAEFPCYFATEGSEVKITASPRYTDTFHDHSRFNELGINGIYSSFGMFNYR